MNTTDNQMSDADAPEAAVVPLSWEPQKGRRGCLKFDI
jgi:hypothetical protein